MKEKEFLVFDNYPFKLAVIQLLMYELELLGSKYNGGDAYFEQYEDVAEVSDEESIKRLMPYIEKGNTYFGELKIPCSLADKVTELYVGDELDVYFHINPQWLDFDEYFEDGKEFDIVDISEEEIKQFPNLKYITFNMYHEPPKELIEKLEGWGIEVNPQD